MKLIDLIEHISEPDDTGLLRIKPFKHVHYKKMKSVTVYSPESIYINRHGELTFDDDRWRETDTNTVDFSTLSGAIRYEVKAAFLLANYSGFFEGGQGIKFNTVCVQISPLIKFAETLQGHDVASFAAFNALPSLVQRNHFIRFLTEKLDIEKGRRFNASQHRFFIDNLNYGLFTDDTLAILNEELNKKNYSHEKQEKSVSHAIVPSCVLKQVIMEGEKKLATAASLIDDWEAANDKFVCAIRNKKGTRRTYEHASTIAQARDMPLYVDPLRSGFEALNNLKLHVLMYVLTYTGMRKEEASSCTIGCAEKHDEKYYVEAVLTKTDETKIMMKWVANKDTFDAIELLVRYVKAMHKRARAILENTSLKITPRLEHHLRHGLKNNLLFGCADTLASIRFVRARLGVQSEYDKKTHGVKDPKFSLHIYQFALTAQDIDQLESLGCNYKSVARSGKDKKYVEGDVFRITPHMLRHNFAWFIIANRLGELDDIKHQFKHLASSMTMVYASRGYQSSDEMIGLFEDFEELLVDNIAQNIINEAADGTLVGEGGKRLNDGAKNLIFRMTASSGSDTGRTVKQIHFKSLNAYKNFLNQNLKNIRGLPHGYCTAGSACKLKNVGLPSGCVYCPSYLVTKKQQVHWKAMKNFADEKLEIYNHLPSVKQSEFSLMAESWKNTSNAASVILADRSLIKVDKVIA